MTSEKQQIVELLAPARNIEVGRKAIMCGADAIYIGASSHGARASAGNSVEDIATLVRAAHGFGVKVYVTVNTIVYDHEIAAVEKLIRELYRAGVDALIVQDMGILRMDIPAIDLHASTQCDIRDARKAQFLARAGFSRVVLARELSLEEIQSVHRQVDVELEAFVHGALCVSYSGDCRASYVTTGRSANRGECAQICRLKYDLTDRAGNPLAPAAHYLSLRDLNRINDIGSLVDAGVTSLKIEGRLKDEAYVMNAVAAYSAELDRIIALGGNRLARSSYGTSHPGFRASLEKGFNRGFTSYFFTRPSSTAKMASLLTPKMTGAPVAKVVRQSKEAIEVKPLEAIANGDGLGFFAPDGKFDGFRVNRVAGTRIYPASRVKVTPGAMLYRNRDKAFDDMVDAAQPERTVSVDMRLSVACESRLILSITDEAGHSATAVACVDPLSRALTPQAEHRRRVLSKLGDTRYRLRNLEDLIADSFVPASVLTQLRRDAVEALDDVVEATYAYRYRKAEQRDGEVMASRELTIHDNVANRLALEFYADHGLTGARMAVEVENPAGEEINVMTTRYCLRRELGCCLRTPQGQKLPSPLYLSSPGIKLRLDFDCANCRMNVQAVTSKRQTGKK